MVTDEEARNAAAEILAAKEFTRWDSDYEAWLTLLERIGELIPDWLIQLVAWIQRGATTLLDWFADLLRLFGVLGDVNAGVGWVAVVILALSLAAIGWLWRSRRSFDDATPGVERNPRRDHAEMLREAAAAARNGHFLEAAHRVQLATLALLIDFEWLELARSDPNRTLRDRLRASALPAPETQQLIELVDRLERLWFDDQRDDRALFEDWISLDERIVSIATGGAN